MEKKTGYRIYCCIFFVLLWIPLLGMFFYQDREVDRKEALSPFPRIRTEQGTLDMRFLPELGEFFSDHFAFRWEIIEADSLLMEKIFRMSGDDGVIQGRDGYYFYADSIDSYLGRLTMDERELYGTARVLALIQEYVQGQGGSFVFTVAPNKNTLYPQYMPYQYRKIREDSDLKRLEGCLERAGVAYADLKAAFEKEEGVLYHRLDSHWDNRGAALAMGVILDTLGQEHTDYRGIPYGVREDLDGDLYGMVHPLGKKKGEEIYFAKGFSFSYGEGFESTEDTRIYTSNSGKKGSAVVFRDSFGNSLAPFVAEEYGKGYFDRTVPYPVDEVEKQQADTLIFEIVERHLDILAREAPRMPAPRRDYQEWGQEEIEGVSMEVGETDGYTKVSGLIPREELDVDSEIYVRCVSADQTIVYEASPLVLDPQKEAYGYGMYISNGEIEPGTYIMEVLVRQHGKWVTSGYIGSFSQG